MTRLSGESSRTSTSAMAENLPDEMVIEILLRLPPKPLMRFKCVSKRWQSQISNPRFTKSHLERLQIWDRQRIFKTSPFETINYEALDRGIGGDVDRAVVRFLGPSIGVYSLVGSCDGLVCFSVCDGFILYNPTTKEFRKLPNCDRRGSIYGFGCDSQSDDYKIVYHKYPEEDRGNFSRECEVALFSLKSGSWRRAQAQLESDLSVFTEPKGVYWKGALHWIFVCEATHETFIRSFNLSEEKLEQGLSNPQIYYDDECSMGLGIHGDYLSMFYSTYDECFQVWITTEYGEGGSWSKLFSVSTKGIPSEGIRGNGHWKKIPIAYTRSGKIVFKVAGARMILFNPEDSTYRDYPIRAGHNIKSVICEETIVSPYLGCEPSRT